MKTSTIPSLRVEAGLRKAAEDVLNDGETLSSFVTQSLHANIARRRAQKAFIARGLRSRDDARRQGRYVSADAVLGELDAMLRTGGSRRKRS